MIRPGASAGEPSLVGAASDTADVAEAVDDAMTVLREYYPGALTVFGTDLASRDALAVLAIAPTPEQGARLAGHHVAAVLRRAGRQHNIASRAADSVAGPRAEQLSARAAVW
jgi:hypothetical protein